MVNDTNLFDTLFCVVCDKTRASVTVWDVINNQSIYTRLAQLKYCKNEYDSLIDTKVKKTVSDSYLLFTQYSSWEHLVHYCWALACLEGLHGTLNKVFRSSTCTMQAMFAHWLALVCFKFFHSNSFWGVLSIAKQKQKQISWLFLHTILMSKLQWRDIIVYACQYESQVLVS